MTVFPLKKNSFLPPQFVFQWTAERGRGIVGFFLHSFYSGHFLTSNSLLRWHRERLSVTGQRRPEGAQVSILCMDCTLGGSAHRAVGGGVGWDRGLQPLTGKSSNPERRRQERGGKLTADLFSGGFKTIAGDISKLFGWGWKENVRSSGGRQAYVKNCSCVFTNKAIKF